MSPGSGPYEISTCGDTRVGRSLRETMDLAPKHVFANTDDPHPIWIVEKLPNGRYYLYIKGAPTADQKDFVVALLIEQEQKVEWELEELEPGLIRIKEPKTRLLWTATSFEKGAKIALSPFIAGSPVETQAFKFGILE